MTAARLTCPSCQAVVQMDPAAGAQQARCPRCGRVLSAAAADGGQPVWYVARDRQKLGPYSAAQLKGLVKSGQVGPEDMVLREGEHHWVAAATLKGLFPRGVGPEAASAPFAFGDTGTGAAGGRRARRPAARSTWPWLVGTGVAVLALLGGLAALCMKLLQTSPPGKKTDTAVAAKPAKSNPDKAAKASVAAVRSKPSPEPRPVAKKALDLSYIATDFTAAVVLHPARLAKSPLGAALLSEPSVGPILREAGIDPRKVEQAVVLIDPFPAGKPVSARKDGIIGAKWRRFTSRDGRFSARFPVKPTETTRKEKNLPVTHDFMAAWEGGQVTYRVLYTDFGRPADDPKAYLDAAVASLAKVTKSKKDIKIDGYSGVELKLEVQLELKQKPAPFVVTHRIYVVKDRQYQVVATSVKGKDDPAQFAKFFDSFELLDSNGKAKEPEKPPAAEATPPVVLFAPGVILRFGEAVDGKKLLAKNLMAVKEKTFQGKKYYRSTSEKVAGSAVAGFVADERTVLWAPEPTLHKMLAAGDTGGALAERLRDVDLGDDMTGVFVLEPYGEVLGDFIQSNKDQVPPTMAALTTLPEHLQAVTVTVNLAGSGALKLILEAGSDNSADVLEDLAREGLGQAREIYPAVREALAKGWPELARAVAAVGGQLADIRANKVGTRVEIVVPRLAGAADKAAGK